MGIGDVITKIGYSLIIKEAEIKEKEEKAAKALEREKKSPYFNEFAGCRINEYESNHLAILRKHLAECMVLLKSNGDFPLETPCKIAAYGHGVRHTIKGGTGSGEVNSRFSVNVEQGLVHAGFEITTGRWLDAYDEVLERAKNYFKGYIKEKAKLEKISVIAAGMGAVMPEPEYRKIRVKESKKSIKAHKRAVSTNKAVISDKVLKPLRINYEGDVAIYVVGRISGEGNDRRVIKGDYKLNDSEIKDILLCNKKYKKFLLVVNAGGPIDLSPVMEVPNILVLSQLGVETGNALADVILGKATPSGKLTTTWVTSAQAVKFPFGERDDTVYEEGIYVGYRYFDKYVGGDVKSNAADKNDVTNNVNAADKNMPLFPFGHGLSFTDFSISNTSISEKLITDAQDSRCIDSEITVKCTVKNTGKYSGKEVVQVYVSAPSNETTLDKPYQVLAAFAKTGELVPGQSEEIICTFRLRDIASYNEKSNQFLLDSGEYIIRIGNSSRNTVIAGKRNLKKSAYFPIQYNEKSDDVAVDPRVATMSDEELAYLCIGAFDPKGGVASVIGAAGSHVAGAAGETYAGFEKKGLKPLIMADGPAGIRISREYIMDENGRAYSLGSVLPGFVSDFLPNAVVKLMDGMAKKPKKDQEIYNQYATALPIATAIAQSWNIDFARQCGDIIGDEMERFNINLWLAPALNIHRNVLCGRNFEYYSEDPLISGRFAAAVTQGVQAHKGCGVTVKHFLANNQENNRYCNNSVVSERALREIYLRGFEICIKEAEPVALMSSYNLVNGEHTSESRRFISDILRGEWGYKGIVMTDWITGGDFLSAQDSKYTGPETWKVIAAGSELFMPGGKNDYLNLLEAMKDGRISRRLVEKSATRLWKMSDKLTHM